jgi:hypothetical protein
MFNWINFNLVSIYYILLSFKLYVTYNEKSKSKYYPILNQSHFSTEHHNDQWKSRKQPRFSINKLFLKYWKKIIFVISSDLWDFLLLVWRDLEPVLITEKTPAVSMIRADYSWHQLSTRFPCFLPSEQTENHRRKGAQLYNCAPFLLWLSFCSDGRRQGDRVDNWWGQVPAILSINASCLNRS